MSRSWTVSYCVQIPKCKIFKDLRSEDKDLRSEDEDMDL